MAKFLQQLLDAREPLFTSGLHQLEGATGNSGVDVRLIADITHKAHRVMRALKLDTADTTGKELYLALNSYIGSNKDHTLLSDTDYVLVVIDGQVISLNMIDVIENYHHEIPYEKRLIQHARRSLRGEIVERYVIHPRTDESAVMHIASIADIIAQGEREIASHNTKMHEKRTEQ